MHLLSVVSSPLESVNYIATKNNVRCNSTRNFSGKTDCCCYCASEPPVAYNERQITDNKTQVADIFSVSILLQLLHNFFFLEGGGGEARLGLCLGYAWFGPVDFFPLLMVTKIRVSSC